MNEAVSSEVETELINSAHTNILLLKQLFSQAEKWHLNLDTDTSELENRDLLEAVKKWEEREFSSGKLDTSLKEKKKLAPLNEGGPTQLLQIQIQKLEQENQALKLRIKTVETLLILSPHYRLSCRWRVRPRTSSSPSWGSRWSWRTSRRKPWRRSLSLSVRIIPWSLPRLT